MRREHRSMIEPPVVRITAPVLAPDPPRPGFPLIATVAPLAMSGVLFAITGSPFMLVMAVLSPVIAVATMLDGRRQRRRFRRDEAARFASEVATVTGRVAVAQQAERERLRAFTGRDPRWSEAGPPLIAIGRGDAPSGVELGGVEWGGSGDTRTEGSQLVRLRAAAPTLDDAPLVCDVRSGVRVDGPDALAAAVARELVLRLAARLSPATATLTAPTTEEWARALPHAVRDGTAGSYRFVSSGGVELEEVVIAWGHNALDGVHEVLAARRVLAASADASTRAGARRAAERLALAARRLGVRSAEAALPELVLLEELLDELLTDDSHPGLTAPIGVDADGTVLLDLVADGPHAVVAGTTGSGKSELLVSWVLGMAAGRSPAEVSFVLVDFKGGAAFAPLAGLPHVLGTLSDLDERLARRAIESLRAEVLRRERMLAAAGARAIDDLPSGSLARLVVVVDEFAALVTERPELHALFADLSSRGRSLGVHLILCTQRPAGVVRDAVLANVAVRIVLRVADRADSLGLIGDDSASRIPASPRGRAMLLDGSGRRRLVQLALAAPEDLRRASRIEAPLRVDEATGPAPRPWCDPLPAVVPYADLPAGEGIRFGLRDLPTEQRQPVAALEPRHGHLLVLGTTGSGATTALEAMAAGAGERARWLPTDPVELWGAILALDELEEHMVLLADDLDLTLARCDPEHAPELADLVARLLREGPRRNIRVVAAARRLSGPLLALAPQFGSRLLLRLASREEHVLAGGDGTGFDPRAQPGAGTWEGAVVQVALPEVVPRGVLAAPPPLVVEVPERGELAVVSGRLRELTGYWDPAAVRVRLVGLTDDGIPSVDPGRTVLLGDPDAWQSDWAALSRARRDLPIVLHACGLADFRAITRSREVPPPLAPGEVWLVEHGRVHRAVLAPEKLPTQAPDSVADHGIRSFPGKPRRIA
jgi:S-DNA-T family DNA segregation ATPase FtsK/SpoIIIE